MAGIIAGSVGGWSPIERGHDNDSMKFSRSRGRSELESREGVEVHPATKANDPVIVEEPQAYNMPPSQVEEITPGPAFDGSHEVIVEDKTAAKTVKKDDDKSDGAAP
jgi:Ca2+-transporting ATPase